MSASRNVSHYQEILSDFANEQGFESTIPEISTEVVPEDRGVGDGSYNGKTEELTVQVALDGPSHQLAEGIDRDIEVVDEGADRGVVHEGTHREFMEQHPQQNSRLKELEDLEPFQKAHEEASQNYIEQHEGFGAEKSLEEWKEQTGEYRDQLLEKTAEYGNEELVQDVEKALALGGIDEHAARLAERVYNGEDPSEVTRENAYTQSMEFDMYTLQRSDITRADMQSMGEYVAENDLGSLLQMDEDEMIDRFYEQDINA